MSLQGETGQWIPKEVNGSKLPVTDRLKTCRDNIKSWIPY